MFAVQDNPTCGEPNACRLIQARRSDPLIWTVYARIEAGDRAGLAQSTSPCGGFHDPSRSAPGTAGASTFLPRPRLVAVGVEAPDGALIDPFVISGLGLDRAARLLCVRTVELSRGGQAITSGQAAEVRLAPSEPLRRCCGRRGAGGLWFSAAKPGSRPDSERWDP